MQKRSKITPSIIQVKFVVSDIRSCPTSTASLARAIVQMIPVLISDSEVAGVYHYCDTGAVSRSDFAAEIIKQAGLDCRVVPVLSSEYPSAARRPAYSAMDNSKFARNFGFVPPLWKDALQECMTAMGYGR